VWNLLFYDLKEWRQSHAKVSTPSSGLWKGWLCPSYPPPPSPLLMPAWSLLIGPAHTLPHLSWLALSFRPSQLQRYMYGPSESLAHRFSPEDGESMLLQNVGFYQLVHIIIYTKRTS
jgi:hypothetical protein